MRRCYEPRRAGPARGLGMLALLAGALLAGDVRGQGNVIVVDAAAGPGSDFTTIAAAVESAVGGDAIVVRSGTYDPIVLSTGKSLTVMAEDGATPQISETIHVENVGPSQQVMIRGFAVTAADVSFGATFENNDGAVIVEDCTFDGSGGPLVSGGLFASSCASVTLVRVRSTPTLTAGASLGRAALFAFNSSVQAFDCELDGPDGLSTFTGPIPGANGATIDSSFFYGAGCDFEGGDGGNGTVTVLGCTDGGDGGDGVRLQGTAPASFLLDIATDPGTPGIGAPGCAPGAAGQPVNVTSGAAVQLPGDYRSFEVSSPVREGEMITETYRGEGNDFCVLSFSLKTVPGVYLPIFSGTGHIGQPSFTFFRGQAGGAGNFVVSNPLGELGDGIPSITLIMQGVMIDAGATAGFLTSPSVALLLDSAF